MGAWGAGHFENDDALNFLAEVDGPQVLEAAFKMLPPPDEGCIDASGASRAMAAAEFVAVMKGCPSADCPEELRGRLSDFSEPVGEEGVIMLTIQSIDDDQINKLDRALFRHLICFNGKLHPRDMIQNWKVDPDDPAFKAMVDKLLRGDRA